MGKLMILLFLIFIMLLCYKIFKNKDNSFSTKIKNIDFSIINSITIIYLAIPILIFIVGWCKLYIALPLLFLIIYTIIRYCVKNIKFNKKIFNDIFKDKKIYIVLFLIALLWVYFAGIGGYTYQNSDHWWRNSLFDLLINEKWPVILNATGAYDFNIALVYYFALWLPSALVGKMFGVAVAYFAFYLWCALGVSLAFIYLKKYSKLNIYVVVLLFIFFSGLDIVTGFMNGRDILSLIGSTEHLEWLSHFQFSSITTQLFWVFNQVIPAWLFTMLLLNQKTNRYLGFIFSLSLIYCTLPAIALALMVLYKAFVDNFEKFKLKNIFKSNWFKDTFTFENLLCGVPVLFIMCLFVKSNISGQIINIISLKDNFIQLFITLLNDILLYVLLIKKYHKDNNLLYLIVLITIICPFVSINGAGDFCMRVSVPAIILLFILLIDSLEKAIKEHNKAFIAIFIILFSLGAFTPINEFKRTIQNSTPGLSMSKISLTETRNDNFWGNVSESTFFKYIAKK